MSNVIKNLVIRSFMTGLLTCISVQSGLAQKNQKWDTIEIQDQKDYNHNLLKSKKSDFNYKLKLKEMKRHGVAYGAFKALEAKEFKKNYSNLLPGVTDRAAYQSGLVVMLSGAWLAHNKSEKFFDPEFQLTKDVVETIGRKVTLKERLGPWSFIGSKTIKSKNIKDKWSESDGLINSFDLNFVMGSHTLHLHETPAWTGQDKYRFRWNDLSALNERFTSQIPGLIPDHVVTTFSDPAQDEKIINGSEFITTVYRIPGKDYSLVVTWWFVGIERKELVNRFLGNGLGSIVNSFCNMIGTFGVNSFIETTVMRDLARMIDAVRSFDP